MFYFGGLKCSWGRGVAWMWGKKAGIWYVTLRVLGGQDSWAASSAWTWSWSSLNWDKNGAFLVPLRRLCFQPAAACLCVADLRIWAKKSTPDGNQRPQECATPPLVSVAQVRACRYLLLLFLWGGGGRQNICMFPRWGRGFLQVFSC